MNADKFSVFNPRLSAFVGGHRFGAFQTGSSSKVSSLLGLPQTKHRAGGVGNDTQPTAPGTSVTSFMTLAPSDLAFRVAVVNPLSGKDAQRAGNRQAGSEFFSISVTCIRSHIFTPSASTIQC